MAEPTMKTRRDTSAWASRAPGEQVRPRPDASRDSIQQALVCLDKAGKRLRDGEASRTDDALTLLRAAALHLERAVEPRD